ncbi:hypothetical protein [Pedobacter antarcticus]|uniref:hypothetical protein n=1 Tax=Pedobacter antarcticus TaxID=34086 RepID=UPI00292FAF8B|nr:hypothetical protein [Pedobacter antarcticus]
MKQIKEFAFVLLVALLAYATINLALHTFRDHVDECRARYVEDFPDHSEIPDNLNQ